MAADLPGRHRDSPRCGSVGVCCFSPEEVETGSDPEIPVFVDPLSRSRPASAAGVRRDSADMPDTRCPTRAHDQTGGGAVQGLRLTRVSEGMPSRVAPASACRVASFPIFPAIIPTHSGL
jgi:hypothetical protein